MSEPSTRYDEATEMSVPVAPTGVDSIEADATAAGVDTYTKPVLKLGSENPSSKLGGNACCGNC